MLNVKVIFLNTLNFTGLHCMFLKLLLFVWVIISALAMYRGGFFLKHYFHLTGISTLSHKPFPSEFNCILQTLFEPFLILAGRCLGTEAFSENLWFYFSDNHYLWPDHICNTTQCVPSYDKCKSRQKIWLKKHMTKLSRGTVVLWLLPKL